MYPETLGLALALDVVFLSFAHPTRHSRPEQRKRFVEKRASMRLGKSFLVLWVFLVAQLASPTARADSGETRPPYVQKQQASMPADFCAPCSRGPQCLSGLCAFPSAQDANGLCTIACAQASDCPSNFTCTTSSGGKSYCAQNNNSICPSLYNGIPLNQTCNFPSTATDPNAAFYRPCANGLACFLYPSGVGSCLELCSSIDQTLTCQQQETCCYGLDANAKCLQSTATNAQGGCIQIGDIGDACSEPNQSVCVEGATCFYTVQAVSAACYAVCPDGTCDTGSSCVVINGLGVCCDDSLYVAGDVSKCVPKPGACRREVGVECGQNKDCRLNLCLKNGAESACSVACSSDADCPADTADINGDGVADGGSHCQAFGSSKYCWPKTGPAAAPACALVSVDSTAQATPQASGCSCQSQPEGAAWLVGLLAAAWMRRKKFRRIAG